jgi:hypothetical protein
MARRATPWWVRWLFLFAWTAALAVSPWWLGLPLLLSLVAALLLMAHRLAPEHGQLLRSGLGWGLPGTLFALQRALGGNVFAWVIALLGLLTGYTLLAGLEAWLDRGARRIDTTPRHSPDTPTTSQWPQLALAPVGPPAEIIELQLPAWQASGEPIDDPHGGHAVYRAGAYCFDDGTRIDAVDTDATFSPAGRWFVAHMRGRGGIVLRDRAHGRLHRLHGWQLDGWYREQPWLVRRQGDMPLALDAVLGEDAADE